MLFTGPSGILSDLSAESFKGFLHMRHLPNKALETTPITPLGLPGRFGLAVVIGSACLSFFR